MRTILALAAAGLTTAAAAGEWKALFNGKDLDGWTSRDGKAPGAGWVVGDGAMAIAKPKSGGDIWTRDRFGDFVLELEFKTAGNSGVFIRTADPKNNVQTGIEIQVNVPGGPDKHSVGSIYDLVAPVKNAGRDGWNKAVITARGSSIAVELNGEKVASMDLDRWTEAGKNPDGSKNKFKTALKDFKREGHIGFQDHGAAVAYRNVRIRTPD